MNAILYVDDEDDIREIASMSLELDPELEVSTASSGVEALERVRERDFAVIMLDVMMPGMDGPSTFAALREEHGDALPPVLFCTARTQAEDLRSYLELGARGVIQKPFDPMQLAATVKGYLE